MADLRRWAKNDTLLHYLIVDRKRRRSALHARVHAVGTWDPWPARK
jgi:hypothetical protein